LAPARNQPEPPSATAAWAAPLKPLAAIAHMLVAVVVAGVAVAADLVAYLRLLQAAQNHPFAWVPYRSFYELVSAGPRPYAPVISINNITLLALLSCLFPPSLAYPEHSHFLKITH
jgi:hypothetical protein